MANFIPPVNGASLGSYLVKKWLFSQKRWKQADKNNSGSQACEPFLICFFWVDEGSNNLKKISAYSIFFFQLNLLPPYMLCSQVDLPKNIGRQLSQVSYQDVQRYCLTFVLIDSLLFCSVSTQWRLQSCKTPKLSVEWLQSKLGWTWTQFNKTFYNCNCRDFWIFQCYSCLLI